MHRWWADADDARRVLSLVDGADPQQAVATAILGMHALQAEALHPLTQSTLVDGAVVQKHLENVDMEPVTKALDRLTDDTDDASVNQANREMVDQWQKNAIFGAQRALQAWTSAGMSWPTAVRRLSTVVGLPADAMAGPVQRLKATGVSDLDAADAGDRFLMTHAHRASLRATDTVSKSLSGFELAEFNRKRRRDDRGRFAETPDSPDARRERRARRRKRRGLRAQRASRARTVATTPASDGDIATQQPPQVISDLMGLLRRRGGASSTESSTSDRTLDRSMNRTMGRGMDRSRLRPVAPAARTEESSLTRPGTDTNAMKVQDQMGYVFLTRRQAQSVLLAVQNGEFTMAGLSDFINQADPLTSTPSRRIFAVKPDLVQEELNAMDEDVATDTVLLELNTLAINDATPDGFQMADTGRYNIDYSYADIDPDSPTMGMQYESGFFTRSSRNPARARGTERPVPIISARLMNENQFPSLGQDALPFDRFGSSDDVYKNLTGFELAEFNRRHPRDEDGQFTRKGTAAAPQPDDRRSRRARRRQRRQVRAQRFVQAQTQITPSTAAASPSTATGRAPDRSLNRDLNRGTSPSQMNRRLDRSMSRSTARALYPKTQDKQMKFDFASASALPLSSGEMEDLTGLDFEGKPLPEDARSLYDVDRESLDLIITYNLTTGKDAIDGLATQATNLMRQSTMVAPAQDRLVGYETEEAAMQAALEYIADMEPTDTVWNAMVSNQSTPGMPVYYPQMAGYSLDDSKDIIFGSPRALRSLADGFDETRLTPIPASSLSELLAVRATDESLPDVEGMTYRPDPVVRAYWYADRDD